MQESIVLLLGEGAATQLEPLSNEVDYVYLAFCVFKSELCRNYVGGDVVGDVFGLSGAKTIYIGVL